MKVKGKTKETKKHFAEFEAASLLLAVFLGSVRGTRKK
jgi:hypothetical protein